jgi:hypothetical protein
MSEHDLDTSPPMQHSNLFNLLLEAQENKFTLTIPVQSVSKWVTNFTNWLNKNHPSYKLFVDDIDVGRLVVIIKKRTSNELSSELWD